MNGFDISSVPQVMMQNCRAMSTRAFSLESKPNFAERFSVPRHHLQPGNEQDRQQPNKSRDWAMRTIFATQVLYGNQLAE